MPTGFSSICATDWGKRGCPLCGRARTEPRGDTMIFSRLCAGLALLACVAAGCGENLAPPFGELIGPPLNLKALSIDSNSVRLQWDPPALSSDTNFAGYQVEYLGIVQPLPKTATTYTASPLPSGQTEFLVRSRQADGRIGDPVSITWAPAYRFENNYTLQEYLFSDQTRFSGLDVGDALRNPLVMPMGATNAGQLVDVFLAGGGLTAPGADAPLRLHSASVYSPGYSVARFSTIRHSSTSLNYFLDTFPSGFDSASVLLGDNTIYYVLVGGPNATYNVARLHVRLLGGTYPNRSVAINISLQKSPSLFIAEARRDRSVVDSRVGRLALVLP